MPDSELVANTITLTHTQRSSQTGAALGINCHQPSNNKTCKYGYFGGSMQVEIEISLPSLRLGTRDSSPGACTPSRSPAPAGHKEKKRGRWTGISNKQSSKRAFGA